MTDIVDPMDFAEDDDLMIDFTDVQAKSFEPVPPGWYVLEVKDYENRETKNKGKVMPAGTPGTNWEFHIVDHEKYEGKRIWSGQWHHPSSLGFMKAMLQASGVFTEEELSGPIQGAYRDRVLGTRMRCKVIVKAGTGGYSDKNEINAYKPMGEDVPGGTTADTSMFPS